MKLKRLPRRRPPIIRPPIPWPPIPLPPVIILSADDRSRIAQVIATLMAIDRRTKKQPSKQGSSITRSFLFLTKVRLYLYSCLNTWYTRIYTMIDTIILTLTKELYTITDPYAFQPHATWINTASPRNPSQIKSIQNPTTRELRRGIYKPKLTLAHRMNALGIPEVMLKMELSLPKLMFGNNFAELQYKDFTPLITKLAAVLADMGVATTPAQLAQAPVR